MADRQELSASLEDYVEAIYNISAQNRVARVKDIAAEVGVSMPSVTGALHALAARGLVNYDPYSLVTLTPKGETAARVVVKRHRVLARFLEDVLGLDDASAQENACRLEHAMEPEVLARLLKFVEFIDVCPLAGDKFREGFRRFFSEGGIALDCGTCAREAVTLAGSTTRGHKRRS